MVKFIERQKLSISIKVISIVIFVALILIFAQWYFSQEVFYVSQNKYKLLSEQGDLFTYTSGKEPAIHVRIDGEDRTLFIEQEEYVISKSPGRQTSTYKVFYPSGNEYEVRDNRGRLMVFDENGDWVSNANLYVYSTNIPGKIPLGRERYGPSSLVQAAYVEYHTTQGTPLLYFLSFLVLIYGWCGFRYRYFQNFLFIISLKWIWTESHKPNEFYYFMCKVGGIISMGGSLFLFFKSL